MKPIQEQDWVVTRKTAHSEPEVRNGDGELVARVAVTYREEGRCWGPQHDEAVPNGAAIAELPAMLRVLLALEERGRAMLASMPGSKTVDALAEMDTTIPVPASLLRDALAALLAAGVLP